MIRRLYSDLPTFKKLTFGPGLNILLAEKSEGATERHTRNRAGKSSMVELVNFVLGGNTKKPSKKDEGSLFRNPALEPRTFGMEFDLAEAVIRVERSGARASPVRVEGDFSAWPASPKLKDGRHLISNEEWKRVLANLMFGVQTTGVAWSPSFRSMISYFARQDRDGGFHRPVKHHAQQKPADQQVSISYLLGLDWSIPREWQKVRDREESLKQLKKSLKDGAFGHVVDKASVLKTQLVLAQDRVAKLKQQVASFQVVEEYHELEREASALTGQLASLADDNTLDRRYIAELENTTVMEVAPAPADLQRVYEEAGVVLPDLVHQRFDDAKAFHESVIANRRSYLQTELVAAQGRISERDAKQRRLDARRAQVMGILQSAGALDHFAALQDEVARAEAEIEVLRQKYDAAEALESGSLKLRMERARLQERLHQDYKEQEAVVDKAILTFQEISTALYEDTKAGSFTISPTENGPTFTIEIQGSKSKGVNNMQIFCFDMMLTLLSLDRGRSPGFLIHDSHLFDGVDERQIGKALALGAKLAEQYGFQYIVSLNTDDIPAEVPEGFRVEDHALDVRLSDSTEDGGLFGFRFD